MNTDRLKAINTPQRVAVVTDASGTPVSVKRESGGEKRVEAVGEQWRIDDEWWRSPIARKCYEVVLEGGGRVVLYEDLINGGWFVQKP